MGSFLLAVGAALPLPGYSVAPGPTLAADDLIEVAGAEVYRPRGEVLVATVAVRPLTPFVALHAWLDRAVKTVPSANLATSEQRALDMAESREQAVAVALRWLEGAVAGDYESPAVEIRPSSVDGNSAGLALTLGILELLSAGELTGGRRVGVTGAIEADGDVGPVGGVAQKALAVRRAGADHLLVPAGQGDDAAPYVGTSLEIIEVATLDDALAALHRLGGDVRPFR